MGIGMYESVRNYLFKVGLNKFIHKGRVIVFRLLERGDAGNFFPFDIFHGEHSGSSIIRKRLRHDKPSIISQIYSQGHKVICFPEIIELVKHNPPKLYQHITERIFFTDLCMFNSQTSHFLQSIEVLHELLSYPRSLNLHSNSFTRSQFGQVYLTNRGACYRFFFKVVESFGNFSSYFGFYNFPYFFIWNSWKIILK